MVNANSLELGYGIEKLEELAEEEGPIGVQLFDYRPVAMVEAAKKAEAAGAFLIDINMGCPVKKITQRGGGSSLLRDQSLATQIVREVSKAVKIPVSVKTRLGWCPRTYDPVNLGLALQGAGAQLLTVHGRTKQQGFTGRSDWEAIAKVKEALEIPVIANGDINNSDDALNCLQITGADGVMIGRASMRAPWVIGQIHAFLHGEKPIDDPPPKDRLNLAIEHLHSLLEKKGDHGLLVARKHFVWTCNGFKGASALRHALVRANTPNEAIKLLKQKISTLP
tara:strand:+ start:4066 stop:4905 length:840 start_codon:yes stop_codon:yes gene_type:complete